MRFRAHTVKNCAGTPTAHGRWITELRPLLRRAQIVRDYLGRPFARRSDPPRHRMHLCVWIAAGQSPRRSDSKLPAKSGRSRLTREVPPGISVDFSHTEETRQR